MKNKYLNLNRVEFLITNQCSSNCIHCSAKNNRSINPVIDLDSAKDILDRVTSEYELSSIMTFGGESLLYPETTTSILKYAKDLGIKQRQLITNCYWSKKEDRIIEICSLLKESGVNDLLLSIDSFHQEFLDFEIVEFTIKQLTRLNFEQIKIHPCWYESKIADNKYDNLTNIFINKLKKYDIEISDGNILFPSGAAINNFPNKFNSLTDIKQIECGAIPYIDEPQMIESICFTPDCKISGLCYGDDLLLDEFLNNYDPNTDPILKSFLDNGISSLEQKLSDNNIEFDISKYYSTCNACKALRKALSNI